MDGDRHRDIHKKVQQSLQLLQHRRIIEMNLRTFLYVALSFLAVTASFSEPVLADILVLKNGDRITGDIKKIWDAEITIEPTYADEFRVDLPAVHHIESDRDFEIELGDGAKVVATPTGADDDGNQILTVNNESFAVPLASLFELDEPEVDFEWDSNIDLSATVNKGNTDSSNGKLHAETTLKLSDHRHIGELTFSRERQNRELIKENDQFVYHYNWLFRDPLFLAASVDFQSDPIIELDQRIIASVGIGRDLWNRPRKLLSVQIGVGGQTESIGGNRTESTVATLGTRYRHDFFGDDLELYQNISITHNLSGRTNTSYKTTTGVRFEITDLLYANFSIDYNYETDPVEPAVSEDITVLLGGGIEF